MSKYTAERTEYLIEHAKAFVANQSRIAKTGGTCPRCGGGCNPIILERFGHCLACQAADNARIAAEWRAENA